MPTTLCTFVFGLLCFEDPIESTREHLAVAGVVVTTSAGYVADTRPVMVMPDWRKMSETCAADLCFRYFKHCGPADTSVVCDYWIGRFGDIWEAAPFILTITALSQEAMAQAEMSISVLSDPKSRTLRVPLALFRVVSQEKEAPICPRAEMPCFE